MPKINIIIVPNNIFKCLNIYKYTIIKTFKYRVVPKKFMVFLRVKKINNNYYYYLVKSVRIDGKIRQKVVKYIGKSKNLVSMLKHAEQK